MVERKTKKKIASVRQKNESIAHKKKSESNTESNRSKRLIRVESPDYSDDVREFEDVVKNTYRKYKLRNYGMKIKFNINKGKKPKTTLMCGEKEIESYDDVTVTTLDKIIAKIKDLYGEDDCGESVAKNKYMKYKIKYSHLLTKLPE
jgi:hypothetical protein